LLQTSKKSQDKVNTKLQRWWGSVPVLCRRRCQPADHLGREFRRPETSDCEPLPNSQQTAEHR